MAEGGGKARGVLSVNHSRNPPRQRQQSSCTATPRALMSQGSAVANGTDGQGPWHPGGGSCLINPQPQNRARGTGRCFALPCNLAKRAANRDQREKLCPPREPTPATARTISKLSECRGGSALLRKPYFSDSLSHGDLTNICLLTAAACKLTWSQGHFYHRSETTAKGP